jgi:hypothetical protein
LSESAEGGQSDKSKGDGGDKDVFHDVVWFRFCVKPSEKRAPATVIFLLVWL